MSRRLKFLMLCALGAAMAFGCAKNNEQHAPVCPYGQVLAYDTTGYSCHYVSLVPAGFNTLTNQPNQGPGSVLTPPVPTCPAGQTLVNWTGSWFCYFTDQLYPSGGNSPQTVVPPSGRGGEFCTSAGMSPYSYGSYGYSGYGYNSGYNNGFNNYANYTSNLVVTCSPGFQCVAGQQNGYNNTGYNNGYNNGYSNYGYGGYSYGQAGTCVLTGYRGTY